MHFHKWTKWEKVEQGDLVMYGYTPNPIKTGTYIVQERKCEKCGLNQRIKDKTY